VARVRLTPRARDDLDEIWLYIAGDNMDAADRLIDAISSRCRSLADFPDLGPARPDIAPDARMLTIDNYIVLYRRDGDDIEIVRVTHGARRLEALWASEKN
jgi:toxin ParE1/3/4